MALLRSSFGGHPTSRKRTLPILRSASAKQDGGGGEIRTHEASRPSGFQDRRDQPLCHPSGRGCAAYFRISHAMGKVDRAVSLGAAVLG